MSKADASSTPAVGMSPDAASQDAGLAPVQPNPPTSPDASMGLPDAGGGRVADGPSEAPPADASAPAEPGASDLLPIERAWPWKGDFDTALVWPTKIAYFFRGPEYIRLDTTDGATAEPRLIEDVWGGWPADFADGVEAAVDWDGKKAFFFKGNQYLSYDIATDRTDPGYPRAISAGFAGLPDRFNSKIEAVLVWPEGNAFSGLAYFFNGTEYVRYIRTSNMADVGYPRAIAPGWSGYPTTWPRTSLALAWPGGKVFFKNGTQYIRYDVASDKVDPGYPRSFQ